MGRPSLPIKSFNIASDELESARYCAKEQGVSLNKYLRLAVLEKNRGVVQGLETRDALDDIRAVVRESETRNALALESALADLRAEQSAALQANEDLVVKTSSWRSKNPTPKPSPSNRLPNPVELLLLPRRSCLQNSNPFPTTS